MKNLVLIFSVIFLVSGCTTIEEQYTREGIRVKPEIQQEYYDDSPYLLVTVRLFIVRPIGEGFIWDFLISSGAHIPIMDSMTIIMDITVDIMGITPSIMDQGMAGL